MKHAKDGIMIEARFYNAARTVELKIAPCKGCPTIYKLRDHKQGSRTGEE